MLAKRFVIATDLVLRCFSQLSTLPIVPVPAVLWPVKRLFFASILLPENVVVLLILLFILLVVVAVGVFARNLYQAKHVSTDESKFYAEVEKLDAQEQNELKRLVRSGKTTVGPALLDRIAAKTSFIYRDVWGEWRIEREYRRFLKDWDKRTKP